MNVTNVKLSQDNPVVWCVAVFMQYKLVLWIKRHFCVTTQTKGANYISAKQVHHLVLFVVQYYAKNVPCTFYFSLNSLTAR